MSVLHSGRAVLARGRRERASIVDMDGLEDATPNCPACLCRLDTDRVSGRLVWLCTVCGLTRL